MALLLAGLAIPLAIWSAFVNARLDQPYLDEVFHVRQAANYCDGRFDIWDPKITTPPGVYLLSLLLQPLIGCSIPALRLSSAIWLAVLSLLIFVLCKSRSTSLSSNACQHIALNVVLFPVLFFFGALYYTDVASTLSVIAFYIIYLRGRDLELSSAASAVILFALGIVSLSFRQTNIFWVAVFPVGLTFVTHVDRGHQAIKDSMRRHHSGFGDSLLSIAKTSFKLQTIYDPPVNNAYLEDYFKAILSLACCSLSVLSQPKRMVYLLGAVAPFLALLIAFAGFVAWNGSVVLGDKSNHVATIHLTQMLYIWPYMIFFSWPLVLPYLLLIPVSIIAEAFSSRALESLIFFRRQRALTPRLWPLIAFTLVALAVVHFNTIIHPFTLADNRHYTFYVFRILRRSWWIRYAVTPLYVICGWAVIQTLGSGPASPISPPPSPDDQVEAKSTKPLVIPDGVHSATISFVLVWLATSTLQLSTAPLVEPRYFILPWLLWRLHVPHTSDQDSRGTASMAESRDRPQPKKGSVTSSVVDEYDMRLWLETGWFVLVNLATMYVFLNWTFVWIQEPGYRQRFMW